ncbi:two pore calcium channel 1 isoform X2 [Paramuricea clavata]|uniref:Two pore calcium channel 1 isoform X2 n=1 Tax=Paramuricea clavata TaxID=317549 RepID=A0A6S7G860_PARCT|nr:two pore calcium channel 1 isoform X2 [Paramuricea clavata]
MISDNDGLLNRDMELVDSPENERRTDEENSDVNTSVYNRSQRSGSRVDSQEQYAFQATAIYLEKGAANEKYHAFNDHLDKSRFLCYLIVHTTLYKVLDVVASLALLALAAIEHPAMLGMDVPIWVHGTLEASCLLISIIIFGIKIRWQGIQYSKYHKRTLVKALLIITMTTEIIVVLIRNDSHVRVTRAARPLFLLDTYYFGGVRRVFRDILKSMPPVLDIFALLLFFMVVFAILGFYFFSTNENDKNFSSFPRSFVSLFVLVTTANYPDVMMPAYHKHRGAVFFFVVYIAVALYFLMNLLLATVYSTFSSKNQSKFTKLYLHKREGARLAYNKITDPVEDGIDLRKFQKLLKYFKPRMSALNKVLAFKLLDKRRSGKINLDEFRHIYGVTKLSWRRDTNGEWFYNWDFPVPVRKVLEGIHLLVTKPFKKSLFYSYFDILIYIVIFINGCTVVFEVVMASNVSPSERDFSTVPWFSHIFTAIYATEAVLKILALGPRGYFDSYWNWFDLFVTILNILGSFDKGATFATYLRPIRLLLLFKLRKTYRVVFDTLRILLASLVNLGIVIVLFYYFFAIIGIEAFAGIELKSCCRNFSIQDEYEEDGYYYLNNFNDFFHSYVTLFELTVVNNWHVIMEGFAIATTEWSRIFFMVFYVVILVVMTIVVAFILDAFVFCIEFRKKHQNSAKDTHKVVFQTYLTKDELKLVDPRLAQTDRERIIFIGERVLTRDDLVEEMYKDELEESCRNQDDTLRSQQSLRANPSLNADRIELHDHSTVSSVEEDT